MPQAAASGSASTAATTARPRLRASRRRSPAGVPRCRAETRARRKRTPTRELIVPRRYAPPRQAEANRRKPRGPSTCWRRVDLPWVQGVRAVDPIQKQEPGTVVELVLKGPCLEGLGG